MPCSSIYCINNTGLVGADDTYITGGTHNGYTYWSGQTNGWVIFYSTGTTSQWCLSDTFSGSCSLAGKTPCFSSCPDLSTAYVYSGVCPTPTPTPTNNCSVLDFNAVFDCEFIPTPTITPTSTITPTPTITPTATNPCSIIGIDAIAYRLPQTLPSTIEYDTPLQVFEPLTIMNCGVSGDVTFNLINDDIICTTILTFQNCFDNELYYCTNVSLLPGQTLELYQVYQAIVDNESNCITYIGNSNNNVDINTNQIIIKTVSFGNVNNGKCIVCESYVPPTPTPTPTPTLTPTPICITFVLNFDDVSQIYTYNYDTNITTNRTLSIPSFTNILGVANTNNRLWSSQNNSYTSISEWSLNFNPFSTSYIRDINFPTIIPTVIDAINNTKLICIYNNNIYEADITTTTATESFKFSLSGILSSASYVSDITLSTSGKLFVIGNSGYTFNNTLQQYNYITGVLETEVTYTLSFDTISSIVQFSGNLYVLTNNSKVYQVQTTSPYALTLIQTDGIGFGGSSQKPGCLTQSLVSAP